MNDTFSEVALNGPNSHPYTCPDSPNGQQYQLDFGSDDQPLDFCANEISRWCADIGLPWFERFRDPQNLIANSESPLRAEEKERLRLAMEGKSDWDLVRKSTALLGIAESS